MLFSKMIQNNNLNYSIQKKGIKQNCYMEKSAAGLNEIQFKSPW